MRVLGAMIISLTVAAFAPRTSAVAPHLILLHGESLTRPIFVTEPHDLFRFMCALENRTTIDASALAGRPFISLSAFWGSPWVSYAAKPRWQTDIRADQANHHGRFYPAAKGGGAVFVSTAIRAQAVPEPKTLDDFSYAHPLPASCAVVLQQFVARDDGR